MWYLGVCEGHQGLVSARATGGTHTLQRRQANGQRRHLSLWSGRQTSAATVSTWRKLRNSKGEPAGSLGPSVVVTVTGRGHCRCHGGGTLRPNWLTAVWFSKAMGANWSKRILHKAFESYFGSGSRKQRALPCQSEAQGIEFLGLPFTGEEKSSCDLALRHPSEAGEDFSCITDRCIPSKSLHLVLKKPSSDGTEPLE